ncbi:MAG: hypothetical protein WC838_07665, partial [Candidatus Margulisiibacteriota bacterium]
MSKKESKIVTGYVFLAILLAFTFSAYVLFKARVPQQGIKHIVEKEISKALNNEPVKITTMQGGLISQLVAEDVQISDFITCKKVEVNYDLLGTALKGGDILANIRDIVLLEPEIRVVRDQEGRLNILKILAPPVKNAKEEKITLRGKITIKNA